MHHVSACNDQTSDFPRVIWHLALSAVRSSQNLRLSRQKSAVAEVAGSVATMKLYLLLLNLATLTTETLENISRFTQKKEHFDKNTTMKQDSLLCVSGSYPLTLEK